MRGNSGLTGLSSSMFWDVDPVSLDVRKHWRFVICRVMRFGNAQEVRWMLENFSEDQIRAVVRESRELDRKTATFWALHFSIPTTEIRCLQQQFQPLF